MSEETWVPALDFPGYTISSKGRVKNRYGRYLKGCINKKEKLLMIALRRNKKSIWNRLGKIVYESFHGKISDEFVLRFKDKDRTNVKLSNLYIKQKQMYLRQNRKPRGRLTPEQIMFAQKMNAQYFYKHNSLYSVRKMAESYGVCEAALSRAIRGLTYKKQLKTKGT